MEVGKQATDGLEEQSDDCNTRNIETVVRRRSKIRPLSQNSLNSLSEICLDENENNETSLLNFAVMENACLVTRKRRSRSSCVEVNDGEANAEKASANDFDTLKTTGDNFLMMEKASTAIRRRRTKSVEITDGQKNF